MNNNRLKCLTFIKKYDTNNNMKREAIIEKKFIKFLRLISIMNTNLIYNTKIQSIKKHTYYSIRSKKQIDQTY